MRKINFVLWCMVVFCGVLTSFLQFDGNIVVFLKNISVVFTVSVPYIFEKISGKKVNSIFLLIWIVFIFLAHYIGVILYGYNHIAFYDKIVHTFSGVLSAYVAIVILKHNKITNVLLGCLFIVSFSWLCAGMWEVFEFVCNILVGGDAQKVAETGVDDTMLDMIVAFGGSLVLSIAYYFNAKKCKK